MSGIEIVGLVLGAVPLLISGLEHYNEGLVPLKDILKYEYVVKELVRALNLARSRLRNTCEKLLVGLVDDADLAQFLDLASLNADAWKRPDLEQKLQERLDQSYDGYMATIAHLAQTIFVFADKMGLDSQFRPMWAEKSNKKRTRDVLFRDELKRKSAKLWKRVKLGLDHNEFTELIKEMAHENLQLEVLTQGNLDLEPIRRERTRDMDAGYWKASRDFVTRIYNCLVCRWPCSCGFTHKANLRLDVRESVTKGEKSDGNFEVVFDYGDEGTDQRSPWDWRNTQIRSFEALDQAIQSSAPLSQQSAVSHQALGSLSPNRPSQTRNVSFRSIPSPPVSRVPSPDPQAKKIEDLCSALACQSLGPCCIGYLDDDEWQHHIYLSAQKESRRSAISLSQVLSSEFVPNTVKITTKDRYELASLLSSAVLQLYDTPWLEENWTRNDVYLLNSVDEKTLVRNAYVSRSFPKSNAALASHEEDPDLLLIRNVSVFNLGLALLELTYGHPIEYYETENDLRNGSRTAMTKMLIAQRLIKQIEEYEGKRYSDVVYRCIHCDFGSRDTSFDSSEFRQKFYKGVVVPLQGILNDFVK